MDGLVLDGYRPGTRKNLSTQAQSYYEFCHRYSLEPFPAKQQQIIRYAAYLFLVKGLKSETIANYIAGVRTLHWLVGLTPPEGAYLLKQLLKGVKARDKRPKVQALPLEPSIFLKLLPSVKFRNLVELVSWVALLMGFHLLLRASNLTATSKAAFDPSINLTRRDFRMKQDIMLVHIKWTKTLQFKEHKLLIPVIPFTEIGLSAVKWFQYMISVIPAQPDDPAFSIPHKKHNVPLTYSQLDRCLKSWASSAGIKGAISLHGLR